MPRSDQPCGGGTARPHFCFSSTRAGGMIARDAGRRPSSAAPSRSTTGSGWRVPSPCTRRRAVLRGAAGSLLGDCSGTLSSCGTSGRCWARRGRARRWPSTCPSGSLAMDWCARNRFAGFDTRPLAAFVNRRARTATGMDAARCGSMSLTVCGMPSGATATSSVSPWGRDAIAATLRWRRRRKWRPVVL
jgi:hypothetical protein